MKKHICTHCGEEFTGKKRKYCNDKCRHEYNKVRQRKQYRLDNNIKSRSCPICDKEFEPNRNGALTKYCSQNCADEARRIRNRERWRKANPGWDDGTNRTCEWCGQAFTVPARNAHIARFCSDECRDRSKGHKPWEEHLEELEQQRQERLELLRQNMIKNWPIQDWEYIGGYTKGNSDIQMKCVHCNGVTTVKIDDVINRKTYDCTTECIEEVKHKQEQSRLLEIEIQKQEEWEALPVKECTVCGSEFKSWQPTQVTCSKKCSRTHANRKKKAYDKATKSQVEVIDNDITVEGLFERDKGICHLCGDECNPKDFEIRDGHFIVGKSYPSIDHLIPRSKNGVHSWDNVKLAHHYCNTIKNNHEDEAVIVKRIVEMAL
jgi:predicted nucleic acid-binding Zn ribbon protein